MNRKREDEGERERDLEQIRQMSGLVEEEIVDPPVQPEENVFGSNSDVVQPWYPFFFFFISFSRKSILNDLCYK